MGAAVNIKTILEQKKRIKNALYTHTHIYIINLALVTQNMIRVTDKQVMISKHELKTTISHFIFYFAIKKIKITNATKNSINFNYKSTQQSK